MTHTKTKGSDTQTQLVHPVIAGIAGVIAGGVAVAAAVALSDKKNQEKIKDVLSDTKDKVTDYVKNVKEQPVVVNSVRKLEEVSAEAKKKLKNHA